MPFITQVSFRDMPPSEALEKLVHEEASKLERFFDGIVSCRVVIELVHHRAGTPFNTRIELSVPGEIISVNHTPDVRGSAMEDDPAPSIHEAFRKARRQLQDYVQRRFREPHKGHN